MQTAEEFAEIMLPRGVSWQKEYSEMLIEFAKLHVIAALEAAMKNVRHEEYCPDRSIDLNSIKDSYPEENII